MKTAFINLLFFYFSRANQIYAHEEFDKDSQPLSKRPHPSAHPPAPKVALPGMVSWIYRVRVRVCPWPIVMYHLSFPQLLVDTATASTTLQSPPVYHNLQPLSSSSPNLVSYQVQQSPAHSFTEDFLATHLSAVQPGPAAFQGFSPEGIL